MTWVFQPLLQASQLLASAPPSGVYTLTAQGGSYSLTGGSAVFSVFDPTKPVLISVTPITLGQVASPGAQAITVPSDAEGVVVHFSCYTASAQALSLTSNFAGTFTINQDSTGSEYGGVAYADVTSTGSKTITPSWSSAPSEGPLFFVSFVKNIDTSGFVRDSDYSFLDSSGSAASITLTTTSTDLVIALDKQYDTAESIPSNPAGWTSQSTQGNADEGGRLRTADTPGSSTTTVTAQTTSYSGVSGISIKAAPTGGGYTLTAQGGSYAVTGGSASLLRSKVLTASGGSYAITGQSITVKRSKYIVAVGGSYNITGQQVTILRNKNIVASGGAYSITGQQATLSKSKYLIAQGGTYSLTGGSATITWTAGSTAYTLICQGGSYILLGASVGISRNRNLTASSGSYTYTGASATIKRNKSLQASGGTYTYTGSSATLLKSKTIQASGGTYTLTGNSAVILKNKVLVGSGGSYIYTGQSAILTRSRLLQALGGVYDLTGASVTITRTISGGYPDPADVRLGVLYGPTGIEYTGTLDIGKKFRIDIATGNIVMIIDSGKVMSL